MLYKTLFKKILQSNTNFTNEEKEKIDNFIKEGVITKENEQFVLNSKYKIGTLKLQNRRAILKDLTNEHKDISLDFEHLFGAYDGDFILAKRLFNPRSRTKAKVIRVLDGLKGEILVYVKDKTFYTVKENIKLDNEVLSTYKEGEVLLLDNKSFDLVKSIGNISDSKVDEFISLHLYNEVIRLEPAIEVKAKMDDEKQRVDLTHLPFCTIDPNSAKDHDDAIYYDEKEEVLYVAIADVSYFVKEGSILDKLAFKKSTSVYLPGKVLPMLPNALSEDMCSLKEGVDRYSYVFKMSLNIKNKDVKKAELFEAIINSHKKFSYGRIDRVLEGFLDQHSKVEKEIFDYLVPLYEVTKSFRAKRLEKGYDFRTSEFRLRLQNGEIQSIEEEHSTASHQLIEECMLLANIEASKKVNTVGIFRIHEEPPFKAISQLVDDVNILGVKVKLQSDVHDTITHIQEKARRTVMSEDIDELIIHSQTQAKYSSKNFGHFGLGFKSYSHFTSPIRRYSDLVLHRMLKTKETPSNIDEICEYISTREREVDKLVWDFEDRKYARWASKNIGTEIKVKIVDVERSKAICCDKMKGMKVVLENYRGQTIYSKQKVKIKNVDIMTKEIIALIKY